MPAQALGSVIKPPRLSDNSDLVRSCRSDGDDYRRRRRSYIRYEWMIDPGQETVDGMTVYSKFALAVPTGYFWWSKCGAKRDDGVNAMKFQDDVSPSTRQTHC